MKKIIALALALALLTACFPGLGETAHEHTWGEWIPAEGGHTAVCTEDGEALTVKHYTFSTTMGGKSVSVCAMCGQYREGIFPLIEGAQAVSQKAKPSNQRGSLIARGLEKPFSDDETVVYAFTVAYVQNGALATWKDVSTVSLPIAGLPGNARLIRISPAAGDDSVQNPEQRIEMESVYQDGVLTFTTKTPALYLLVAE
jgi:hypothetical protein